MIIAQEFGFSVSSEEKAKIQKDHSLKLELIFNESEAKLIEKVKALTSHQNPDQSWKDLILLLAKKELKKWEVKPAAEDTKNDSNNNSHKDKKNKKEISVELNSKDLGDHAKTQHKATPLRKTENNLNYTEGLEVEKSRKTQRKYLSIKLKRKLFSEANHQCQYVDPLSQLRCSGTHFLQIDHFIPLANGGSDEFENLRVLCQSHNLKSARDWGLN